MFFCFLFYDGLKVLLSNRRAVLHHIRDGFSAAGLETILICSEFFPVQLTLLLIKPFKHRPRPFVPQLFQEMLISCSFFFFLSDLTTTLTGKISTYLTTKFIQSRTGEQIVGRILYVPQKQQSIIVLRPNWLKKGFTGC